MLYSSAGFLALIIHLIINHDILLGAQGREIIPAHLRYRRFLLSVTFYYVTDILWGILYERRWIALTHLDTAGYFLFMGLSILLWTRFVIEYLKQESAFGRMLSICGQLFFGFEIVMLAANFFLPVLYYFDESGIYHAGPARYITLGIQIVMFTATAIYALLHSSGNTGTMKFRHRTIGLFSLSMAGFIIIQTLFPLLPLYAIGCLLGSCVLHSFVLENEKKEYRDHLEEKLRENMLKGNYYDLLTGLPGMSYFFDLVKARRTEMQKSGRHPAFLYLNLSGMKFYNRERGFAQGDQLLRAFSRLLIQAFGNENCSRFGQDHFAVFTAQEGLEDTLRKLFDDWEALDSTYPPILAGIYPDSLEHLDISAACDQAKIACDAIRHTWISSYRYFDSDMLSRVERQQYIITHLDQALAQQWIQVFYQPIVRASNGRVCDEEALSRWIDPVRGFLSPGDFIPILEESKLIYRLDLYIVDQVLDKIRRMREHGLFLVPQSINLSRSDFDSCDMVEEIRRRVDGAGLPHNMLTIEITESIIGSDFDFIKGEIERFRALGFPVWMDDFGSGYSSLDVLQSLHVDLIKFDMRFMQQFTHGDKSKIILTELMKMAIGLGIDTVCEGVERADQVEFLREIGCSKLQGFFYGKPIPLEKIFERYDTGVQIGFEDPGQSGYFDAIDRINLYDLAVIANEEDTLQHYFSTVPMAIIEVLGKKARFARSNQAYRDFIMRTFHTDIKALGDAFEAPPEGIELPFVETLMSCCREGGRTVFDRVLPDGTTVHIFVRRIAENPRTGTIAAALAVLAVTK